MKTYNEIVFWLKEKIAEEHKTTSENISIDTPFTDLGIDSIVIVTLVSDLEQWLNITLDPTIFWEYPTINILTDWLINEKLSS